ncbi:MAG: extracellular solute-binding protein [Proteobacteria bacterium]|nr:extracellular solute-binding protein [Pseudomonadota bacterium]
MNKVLMSAIAFATLAAVSGTAQAQKGEVVYYGYKGPNMVGAKVAFEKLYPGITVKIVTGDGGQLRTRIVAEKDNPRGDVLYGDSDHFLNHTFLFKPYISKHHAAFPKWALFKKDGQNWAYGYNISIQVFAVNTKKMKVEDAPKSWKELTLPKYKGKFMVSNPALASAGYYSFSQMLQMYGWNEMEKYIENARFVSSTNAVPSNVSRGEVEFGLVEETKSWALAEKGFPVKVIYPSEGIVPTVAGIGILKNSPNPENALLFAEFLNSLEGHNINVATRNRRTPRPDSNPPKGLVPLSELKVNTTRAMNIQETIEMKGEWMKKFDEILNKKGKKGAEDAKS